MRAGILVALVVALGGCGSALCDYDRDGYDSPGCNPPEGEADCNDIDPMVNPGQAQLCMEIDTDCDWHSTYSSDRDEDGKTPCQGDCDDGDPNVTVPGDAEDYDGDGYSLSGGDCDDCHPGRNPGAEELSSTGFDDNCDGEVN